MPRDAPDPATDLTVRAYLTVLRSGADVPGGMAEHSDLAKTIRVESAPAEGSVMGPTVTVRVFGRAGESATYLELVPDLAEALGRKLIRHARRARGSTL